MLTSLLCFPTKRIIYNYGLEKNDETKASRNKLLLRKTKTSMRQNFSPISKKHAVKNWAGEIMGKRATKYN